MSISNIATSGAHAAQAAAVKPQAAPPPAPPKVDTDGDRDGSGSAGSKGLLNIKA